MESSLKPGRIKDICRNVKHWAWSTLAFLLHLEEYDLNQRNSQRVKGAEQKWNALPDFLGKGTEELKSWADQAEDPLEGLQGMKPCTLSAARGRGRWEPGWGLPHRQEGCFHKAACHVNKMYLWHPPLRGTKAWSRQCISSQTGDL